MKTSRFLAFVLAGASGLACGSLGNANDRPVLATLRGELTNPQSLQLSSAQAGGTRVAVVWLGELAENYSIAEDLPVQPVFPAQFKLNLTSPPPDEAIVTAAKEKKKASQATPPGPVPQPTPAPPSDSGGSKPKDFENARSWPADFGLAVGSVVAYDDLNGNGKLDLVDEGATAYVDRILGSNDSLILVYFQGTFPPGEDLRDDYGVAPALGFNLFHEKKCAFSSTLDGPGASPTPPPCTDKNQWLSMDTLFTLPLTADPKFSAIMCRKGGSGFGPSSSNVSATPSNGGSGGPTAGDAGAVDAATPPPDRSLPAANDPKLQCSPDGRSFTYDCHPTPPPQPKLCGDTPPASTSCGAWPMPNPPPPNWPCPVR